MVKVELGEIAKNCVTRVLHHLRGPPSVDCGKRRQ
jgi:hypothetical protein